MLFVRIFAKNKIPAMHHEKPNIFFLCGPAMAGESSALLSVEMLFFLYAFAFFVC